MKTQKRCAPIIAVIIIALVGTGAYAITHRNVLKRYLTPGDKSVSINEIETSNEKTFTPEKTTTAKPPQEVKKDFTGTQDQLMIRGGNYYCTFDNRGKPEIDLQGDKGYFYISGDKASGFVESKPGMTPGIRQLHIVRDGDAIYQWFTEKGNEKEINLPTKSYFDKTKATFNRVKAGLNPDGSQKYWDMPKQTSVYNCKSWTPDPKVFELPGGITFDANSELIY